MSEQAKPFILDPKYAAQLAEEEKRIAEERRRLVAEAAADIKKILCDKGLTLEEWHRVVDSFNAINARVVPAMTFKEMVKRDYPNYGSKDDTADGSRA